MVKGVCFHTGSCYIQYALKYRLTVYVYRVILYSGKFGNYNCAINNAFHSTCYFHDTVNQPLSYCTFQQAKLYL